MHSSIVVREEDKEREGGRGSDLLLVVHGNDGCKAGEREEGGGEGIGRLKTRGRDETLVTFFYLF